MRSLMLKNTVPGLAEIGKIKIGRKGATRPKNNGTGSFQMPEKLDHFLITTLERGSDNNFLVDPGAVELLGEKPVRIPIMLMYDQIELNFQSQRVMFDGIARYCSGDNEEGERLNEKTNTYEPVRCPCPYSEPQNGKAAKCKVSGCLSCMIIGLTKTGGVHKFRTTGKNSVSAMTGSLQLIRTLSGGRLAGLELELVCAQKTGIDPITQKAVKFTSVTVLYNGLPQALMNDSKLIALNRAKFQIEMKDIESEARKLIKVDEAVIGSDPEDHAEEFYPDEVSGDAPELVPTENKEPHSEVHKENQEDVEEEQSVSEDNEIDFFGGDN